ncbi:hypothetical protein AVO51_17460 [Vibrio cholerae]|nr:hypothetical protein AVO51_17460 [Vibrio cholerae]
MMLRWKVNVAAQIVESRMSAINLSNKTDLNSNAIKYSSLDIITTVYLFIKLLILLIYFKLIFNYFTFLSYRIIIVSRKYFLTFLLYVLLNISNLYSAEHYIHYLY